jgi:uncharacterized protein YkwD
MRYLVVFLLALFVSACTTSQAPTLYASLASATVELDRNQARDIFNAYRREKGLRPLRLDADLNKMAEEQSAAMAARDEITHAARAGDFDARLERTGLKPQLVAENIAGGHDSIAEVFAGWRASPPHDKNLLIPDARRMGIAAVYAPDTRFKVFWTLVVAGDELPEQDRSTATVAPSSQQP